MTFQEPDLEVEVHNLRLIQLTTSVRIKVSSIVLFRDALGLTRSMAAIRWLMSSTEKRIRRFARVRGFRELGGSSCVIFQQAVNLKNDFRPGNDTRPASARSPCSLMRTMKSLQMLQSAGGRQHLRVVSEQDLLSCKYASTEFPESDN